MFKGIKGSARVILKIIKTSKLTALEKLPTVSVPLKAIEDYVRSSQDSIVRYTSVINRKENVWTSDPDVLRGETFITTRPTIKDSVRLSPDSRARYAISGINRNENVWTSYSHVLLGDTFIRTRFILGNILQGKNSKIFNSVITDELKKRIKEFVFNEKTQKVAKVALIVVVNYTITPGAGMVVKLICLDINNIDNDSVTNLCASLMIQYIISTTEKGSNSTIDVIEKLIKDISKGVASRLIADAIKHQLKKIQENMQSKKDNQSKENESNKDVPQNEVENKLSENITENVIIVPVDVNDFDSFHFQAS